MSANVTDGVETLMVATPAVPLARTVRSVVPVPASTSELPQTPPEQIVPAPEMLAVIDSGAAPPAALYVRTGIVAWTVDAAVATAVTAASDVAVVAVVSFVVAV